MIPVGVFAKPPHPGLVKTRLIPELGADNAARIYRYCLEYTLEVVRKSELEFRIYLSDLCDEALFQSEDYSLQQGPDLGTRMLNAIQNMLATHPDGAMIIGSDCLDITPTHLLQAARALTNHELVLLPAMDGGYALIGCTRIEPELFRDVSWSSKQVLEQTLVNATQLKYRVSLLETVRDIDTLQDGEQYPELLALIT